MNIADFDYRNYAELLVKAGAGLKKDMNIVINFDVNSALLARECAAAAYREGARLVDLRYKDTHITKARVNAQAENETALKAVPKWVDAWQDTVLDGSWTYLSLVSFEDIGLLSDIDQHAYMIMQKAAIEKTKKLRDAVTGHKIPWSIGAVPGPEWAKYVLGENAKTEDLWKKLIPILLLDKEDPVEAWKDKGLLLTERADKLNSLKLDALHFSGNGTDLTVGLLDASIWKGGPEFVDGHFTMPNIPTEEVFTTPDRLRTEGTVKVTKPVEVRGTVVKNAVFTFKNGKLVDYSAQEGEKALTSLIETDEGASYLGEVALVAEDSPIAESGLLFGSILFDENASCHIALGSGYTPCVAGGDKLDTDEKKIDAGCNASFVHVDFMIGSPEVSVTGIDKNGKETPVIVNGKFAGLL